MAFDIPYLFATAVVVALVAITFEFVAALKAMPKWRRISLHMATIFAALLILNLVWPYVRTLPTTGA